MLVFGHTHKPWVHEYGEVLFVNCGSVGKPKDGDPRGAFAVLTSTPEGVDVTIERVAYDAEAVAVAVRRSRAPGRVRGQAPDRCMTSTPPLARRLLAELLGSALLAAVVIGSGIAAQNLSPGNTGLQLLENALATAAGLFAIILMFGPVSGGHFNPVVSLADAWFGGIKWRDALAYIPTQIAGCVLGAIVANGMFALAAVSISTHHRASAAHLFSEVIATAGLLLVIFSLARTTTRERRARRCRRLHRRRVLLHELRELRQPRDQHRADVLEHVRRHRASIGTQLHSRATRRRRLRDRRCVRTLYPDVTPERGGRRPVPPPRHTRERGWGRRRGDRSAPTMTRLVAIGGSDAGISAALRAREARPGQRT